MKDKELFDFLISEAEKPFSGWDFSYISETGRVDSEPLLWSYTSEILPRIRRVQSLLDMGTGGGEYLSMLQPLPSDTYATEGYEKNIPIARNRLEPLGVTVVAVHDDDALPFENHRFDIIINKHESYSAKEVYRILKPNGLFITQQVGGSDQADLNERLGADKDFGYSHWHLDYAIQELVDAGFQILKKAEQFPYTRFYDVGALVYYLKAVPWQIPDFTVETYFDRLCQLHNEIQKNGFIQFTSHRFFIVAKKR
jgi:SAM-dependent methyltransferase